MRTMADDAVSRASRATPQVKATASSKTLGIQGYYCAKHGLQKREPNYTIPKDENTNFFKHVTRATKGVPGPSHYTRPMSWKTPNGAFGVGPARKTFTDEAAKHSKQVPSCAQYNPEMKRKLLLGNLRYVFSSSLSYTDHSDVVCPSFRLQ